MKRVIFFGMLLATGLMFSCNQSQNNSNNQGGMGPGNFNPEEMIQRQVSELKETLNLSSDQEKQMQKLITQNFENMRKMREQRQNSGEGFEGMREQMQKIREEQNNKVKAILSDEQWEKYQVWQEERRARRGQGGPGMN
ncbi:MAG: hypothetical protein EOM73_13675 [Bacteroidia bacterium]|nr:hypothetical protein [Bacteroidia bacterium]